MKEIGLLDYWRVIVKWKGTVILMVLVLTSFSVLITLFLPKTYQAKTTIMPIEGQRTGELTLTAAQLFGIAPSSSSLLQLMAILKSRTLAERMIDKYDLKKVLYPKLWDQQNQKWIPNDPQKIPSMEHAVNNLFSKVTFAEDKKTPLIEIKVEMRDPKVATEIANGYVKELAYFINENTLTLAKKDRIFIEEQLERNKGDLLNSGKDLSEFYAANKISNIMPTLNVDISIETEKRILKEKTVKIENGVLSSHSQGLPGIPDAFADAQKKTDELQKKVGEVESQIQKTKIINDVPQQVYLQYLSLRRELLSEVHSLLTQQYEMAKIEESKEDLSFQVIDWARVPEKRFKPKRRPIVITAFAMSIFLAMFYAFFKEYLEKTSSSSP